MIDVSKLTAKELNDLDKLIKKEKENRQKYFKGAVYMSRMNEIYGIVNKLVENKFGDILSDTSRQDNVGKLLESTKSSILKLCDTAFMNFKPNAKNTLSASGSDLYEISDKFDDYNQMYNDIVDVFLKYSKGALEKCE